jgi:hypothetical protein
MRKQSHPFSTEVSERAVCVGRRAPQRLPPLWAAIESAARKMGCVPQILNEQQDPIARS